MHLGGDLLSESILKELKWNLKKKKASLKWFSLVPTTAFSVINKDLEQLLRKDLFTVSVCALFCS